MNILILNVHSALNLGDDAIMASTLRSLRQAFPQAAITVAANDPASWKKYVDVSVVGSLTSWVVDRTSGRWQWDKVKLLEYALLLTVAVALYRTLGSRWRFGSEEQRQLLAAYYEADLVLSCGGGNFYAHHRASPGLVWSLVTCGLATWLGKRIILLPQSIGPIEGSFQRALARLVFNRAALILLRERRSLDFLRVLRVSRPAHVLPDLAFGLPPVTDEVSKGDVLQIGVTVIDRSAQDKKFDRQQVYEDALASLLVRLSKDYRAHISIFVQCYGPSPDQDDRRSARRLYDRVREQTDAVTLREQFRDALAIRVAYRQMDCMIGTRMHTAIFAFSGGVPVVLIGYQPKAQGIMEQFGLERYWCSIEAVTEAELCRMVCEALDRWEEIRQHIAQRYTQTQEFLQDWTKYLLA